MSIGKKNKQGFTLIELIIIITILGILAAMISGNFITSLKKGRDARRKADLEQIQRALEMYYEDKKAYPLTADWTFGGQFTDLASGKIYMVKVPNDPISGKSYEYQSNGSYYKLYACLENDQQILPYLSTGSSLTCTTQCKAPNGSSVPCLYGISSSNTNP